MTGVPMGELLSVADLSVTYAGRDRLVCAVSGVSFGLSRGSSLGIVGETGCGKSTTVRAIAGLLGPGGLVSAGRVQFGGEDLLAAPPARLREFRAAQIAFLPQNAVAALNPVIKLEHQFRTLQRLLGGKISRGEARDRAADLLNLVGIRDPLRVLGSRAYELSGGMAQRVVMAMVLIREPLLVIADEPTTGLDLTVLRQVMDLLRAVQQERQMALIVVTHDLGLVANYCDSVLVMYGGTVVERGEVSRVLANPLHHYTSGLIEALPVRGQPLHAIPGMVPTLHEEPRECPFAGRCPATRERCRLEVPRLPTVDSGHVAACFYPRGPGGAEPDPESGRAGVTM